MWGRCVILLFALSMASCAHPSRMAATPTPHPTPCSYGGNSFAQSWRLCGRRQHELITELMLVNELHFQYNLRHGVPYDVIDKGNGRRYFVDLEHANVTARSDDSEIFVLPLHGCDGITYLLRWRIDGEFDRYIGSTPQIPLSRAAEPFHLKETRSPEESNK